MRFLDTNIIIRYLTGDDPQKAEAAFGLLKRVQAGGEQVRVTEAIITEVCYILSAHAHYHLSHDEIRQRLTPIINMRGLRLPRKAIYIRALDLFAEHPSIDFEDVLTVAYMEADGVQELYSYDRDFDAIAGVKRVEP